jgi:hypothetical protein
MLEQREKYIGRWAVCLAQHLFKVEEVKRMPGASLVFEYTGRGLARQQVTSHCPTFLSEDDSKVLDMWQDEVKGLARL